MNRATANRQPRPRPRTRRIERALDTLMQTPSAEYLVRRRRQSTGTQAVPHGTQWERGACPRRSAGRQRESKLAEARM